MKLYEERKKNVMDDEDFVNVAVQYGISCVTRIQCLN